MSLIVASTIVVCSCAPESGDYTSNTVAVPAGATDSSIAATSDVRMQHPEEAASIQLCVDTGPDAASTGYDYPALVLDAVARHLEALAPAEGESSRGVIVEAWTASADDEGGGLVLEAEVPDVENIEIAAGMAPEERNAALLRQSEQRSRMPAASAARAALVDALRSVPIPATQTTDLFRCISRANAQMVGRDAGRRLLVVASSFPVVPGVPSVRGDLASTQQVLVLAWGPDFIAREVAWRATWASLGATSNLFVYEADDALGSVLGAAMEQALS